MKCRTRSRFGVVLWLLAGASPGSAQTIGEIPVARYEIVPSQELPAASLSGDHTAQLRPTVETLDDSELAGIRGGFSSASGSTFSFAIEMTTTVDGRVALATTLTLNAQGLTTIEKTGANAESLSEAQKFGLNLAGLPPTGVVVPGPGGATAIIQNTSGQIMNVLVNNANDQAIVQNTSLTLIVPNLPALKQEAQINTVGGAVANAINSTMLQLGGH